MVSFTQQRHTYDFFRHRVYIIIPDIVSALRQILSHYPTLSTAVDIRNAVQDIQVSPENYQRFTRMLLQREPNISQTLHLGVQALEQLCGLCGVTHCSCDHLQALWTYICRQILELPTRVYTWSFGEIRQALDQFLAEQTYLDTDGTCPKTQSALQYRLVCLQSKLGRWGIHFYHSLQSTSTLDQFRIKVNQVINVTELSTVVLCLCETYIGMLGVDRVVLEPTSRLSVDIVGTLYQFLVSQVLPQCPGIVDHAMDSTHEIQHLRSTLKSFVSQELSLSVARHDV